MSTTVHAGEQTLLPFADLTRMDGTALEATEGGALLGSRCAGCGVMHFPRRFVCFECRSQDLTDTKLTKTGTLYSWSVVHISATRPTPYVVGYVDLPLDGVRIFSDVRGPADGLEVDMPADLIVDPDGSWAFGVKENPS